MKLKMRFVYMMKMVPPSNRFTNLSLDASETENLKNGKKLVVYETVNWPYHVRSLG